MHGSAHLCLRVSHCFNELPHLLVRKAFEVHNNFTYSWAAQNQSGKCQPEIIQMRIIIMHSLEPSLYVYFGLQCHCLQCSHFTQCAVSLQCRLIKTLTLTRILLKKSLGSQPFVPRFTLVLVSFDVKIDIPKGEIVFSRFFMANLTSFESAERTFGL